MPLDANEKSMALSAIVGGAFAGLTYMVLRAIEKRRESSVQKFVLHPVM